MPIGIGLWRWWSVLALSVSGNRSCKLILGVILENSGVTEVFFASLWSNSSVSRTTYLPVYWQLSSSSKNYCPWRMVLLTTPSPSWMPSHTDLVEKYDKWDLALQIVTLKTSAHSHTPLSPYTSGTHHHTSALAGQGPRGACHSAHKKLGSYSCRLWSDEACQSWTVLYGTAREKWRWWLTLLHLSSPRKTNSPLACTTEAGRSSAPLAWSTTTKKKLSVTITQIYKAKNPLHNFCAILWELGNLIPGHDLSEPDNLHLSYPPRLPLCSMDKQGYFYKFFIPS